MKRTLKKALALLLAAMLLLSALPTVLAADNENLSAAEDGAYRYGMRAGYAYTVSVDAPGTEHDGYFTTSTPTIQFMPMDYGTPVDAANKAMLTFHNVGEKELNLTFGSSNYADVKWIDNGAGVIPVGETARLEVTPRENIPASHGVATMLLMEQQSRIGWTALLEIEVHPVSVTVTATNPAIRKTYGQTLTSAELPVEVTGGVTSVAELEALGYAITSEGFAANAPVNTYPVAVTAGENANLNYDVLNDGSIATVTVEKATPEMVWVNASNVRSGHDLSESTLEGAYRNRDSGAEVPGTFAWKDSGPVEEATDGESIQRDKEYTFTPTDTTNYDAVDGTVTLTIVGKDVTTIQLTDPAQLNVTYDGNPHAVAFTADHGDVTVQYAPTGTEDWTNQAPTAAGTYQVLAKVEEGDDYASESYSAVLTINPKPITLRLAEPDAIISRRYNGDTDATLYDAQGQQTLSNSGRIQFSGAAAGDTLKIDYSKVTAVYDDPNVGRNKTVTVTVPKDAVTGDLANYSFEGQTFTTKGDIFVLPVELTMKQNITKQYGQSTQIMDADYNAAGLIEGEQKDALHVELYSKGVEAAAAVGAYPVTVKSSWGNYLVTEVAGTFTVEPATPVAAGAVNAGNGGTGRELNTVTLSGTFQNPYTGEIVPGALSWASPTSTLPVEAGKTAPYDWTFTPTDTKNYKTTSGTADITTTAKPPVDVQFVAQDNLVYDGQPKAAKATSTASDAVITMKYKGSKADDWTDAAPTNADTYEVLVNANVPDAGEYADNSITGVMVIQPAAPTGTATAAEPEDGAMLGDVELTPDFKGVNDAALTGSVTWNTVGGELPGAVPLQYGTAYGWTFTPDDPNYTAVSGTVTFEAPDDENQGGNTGDGDNTGGDNTGGDNTGGDNTGGDNTGGDNTGGDNTGGDNTGGDNTGGDNTGGSGESGDSNEDPADEPTQSGVERLLNVETIVPFMSGYKDGTFQPNENVSRAMVAQIFYNLLTDKTVAGTSAFPDVKSDAWYYQPVVTLANLKIVSGTDSGFEPDRPITRAEFATIAAKFANAATGGKTFTDVSGHWAISGIRTAAAYGWINGDGDGTFRPNDPITRAEAASIVNKMLNRTTVTATKTFPDVPKTHWAYDAILKASATA